MTTNQTKFIAYRAKKISGGFTQSRPCGMSDIVYIGPRMPTARAIKDAKRLASNSGHGYIVIFEDEITRAIYRIDEIIRA